jgi:hypothetical protein
LAANFKIVVVLLASVGTKEYIGNHLFFHSCADIPTDPERPSSMQTGPPSAPARPVTRWTDEFLDQLRRQSDPMADEALQQIIRDGEAQGVGVLFGRMDVNDDVPPAVQFPLLARFFGTTGRLPAGVDTDRIHRGEDVFQAHAFTGALALLAKSLPEGYQAPNLSIILNVSGDLRTHTYRRLLGTLQTVVNVSTCHGFQDEGRAVITAQKLRMLHAGVRHLTRRYRPEYEGLYGVPVNQEDMLGTVLGFSLLVIEGWRTLKSGVTPQQEEDFLYLWLIFARMMGIHPPGEPGSTAYLPVDVADASAFYRAYERRHYVDGSGNPDGIALATANLSMLEGLVPRVLRLAGFGRLPGLYMNELMGEEACGRLRLPVHRGRPFILSFLHLLHRALTLFSHRSPAEGERLAMVVFQGLINMAYDGRITYSIPKDLNDLRSMVDKNNTPRIWRVPHA